MSIFKEGPQNRINITDSGAHRVIYCVFDDLHNDQIIGGAVFVSSAECSFYCTDSYFHDCSALTSGGMHISESKIAYGHRICALSCYSQKAYSYFGLVKGSSSLIWTYVSTHFCSGYASTTRCISKQLTVANINSTHNRGYQEPSILIDGFDYADIRYIDCVSNECETIVQNAINGQKGELKHIHFDNSSLLSESNVQTRYHILFHNVKQMCFSDSYVNIDSNANGYTIAAYQSGDIKVDNIYYIGSDRFLNITNIENGILTITNDINTLQYSFINTYNCLIKTDLCYTIKTKNIPFLNLLHLCVIFLL